MFSLPFGAQRASPSPFQCPRQCCSPPESYPAAVDMWRGMPAAHNNHRRDEFVGVFAHFWKELPTDEALTVAHELVKRALKEPDADTSAGYIGEVHFSSRRQHLLFEILHILRQLGHTRFFSSRARSLSTRPTRKLRLLPLRQPPQRACSFLPFRSEAARFRLRLL